MQGINELNSKNDVSTVKKTAPTSRTLLLTGKSRRIHLAQLYKIKLQFFFNYLYNNKDWTVNERRFPVEGVEGEPVLLRGEQQLPSTTLYRKICNISVAPIYYPVQKDM